MAVWTSTITRGTRRALPGFGLKPAGRTGPLRSKRTPEEKRCEASRQSFASSGVGWPGRQALGLRRTSREAFQVFPHVGSTPHVAPAAPRRAFPGAREAAFSCHRFERGRTPGWAGGFPKAAFFMTPRRRSKSRRECNCNWPVRACVLSSQQVMSKTPMVNGASSTYGAVRLAVRLEREEVAHDGRGPRGIWEIPAGSSS